MWGIILDSKVDSGVIMNLICIQSKLLYARARRSHTVFLHLWFLLHANGFSPNIPWICAKIQVFSSGYCRVWAEDFCVPGSHSQQRLRKVPSDEARWVVSGNHWQKNTAIKFLLRNVCWKKKTQSAPVYILVESINGVKIARGFFSLRFHFQYGRRHLFQFNCVCNLRSCNHSDGPVQPLHKQQLGGSSYPRPFLCPHPVWICLLPLQAQVSSSLPVNLPDSREEYKKKCSSLTCDCFSMPGTIIYIHI